MESEYLKSEKESPVKSYPLSGFLTLVKTGEPCLAEPRKGLAGREARARAARTPLSAAREGMLRTPGGAAGGRPPQQVPAAMATVGTSRSRRPEAAPAKLQPAKAKSDPSPGGAKWTKTTPGQGRWAPREPRESLLSRAPHCQSEGTRRSGSRRSAQRWPRGALAPGAAGQRGAAGSIPGRRSDHCANPAGPTAPPGRRG